MLAALQPPVDLLPRHFEPGRQAFENRRQPRAVRLTAGEQAQPPHAIRRVGVPPERS
jgi:hypothetical protein